MKGKIIVICLFTVILCALILTGCDDEKTDIITDTTMHMEKIQSDGKTEASTNPTMPTEEFQKVECFGKIPDKLEKVARNNLFINITAFDGKLLKAEEYAENENNKSVTHTVNLMDVYGNNLASYTVISDDAYHISTLTATNDGGFLFVLGFRDYAYSYANGQGVWASDNGFASRIIKCDKHGNLQFDTPFDGVEGSAFHFCFEKNEKFYFFGTAETPEKKIRGVCSSTDVYTVILDKNGTVLKSRCIAGSDFDSLNTAEYDDNIFLLSVDSQSGDGDFAGSNSNGYPVDWVIALNDDLEITKKEKRSGRDYFDHKIGEREGKPIYKSDKLLKDFDAGTPTAFIDYGDFYLIVSDNITGIYEHIPLAINCIWYYFETVYSGYDLNGNLLFRTAVDSSPDYDTMVRDFYLQSQQLTEKLTMPAE